MFELLLLKMGIGSFKEINQKFICALKYTFISKENVNCCIKCHQVIFPEWMIVFNLSYLSACAYENSWLWFGNYNT